MIETEFSNAYFFYKELHEQLLNLINNGKFDTKEADNLRDQMDSPWYEMNQEERDVFLEYGDG